MTALHVVAPQPSPSDRVKSPGPLGSLLDWFFEGNSQAMEQTDKDAFGVLAEVSQAVMALGTGSALRRSIRLYASDQPWELGLEVDGEDLLLSSYTTGRSPEVGMFERRVTLAAFTEVLTQLLDEARIAEAPRGLTGALLSARRTLGRARPFAGRARRRTVPVEIVARDNADFGVSLKTEVRAPQPRSREGAPSGERLERTDLHALLCRGVLTVTAHRRDYEFTGVYPFLFAECFLLLGEDVFDAMRSHRPLFRRVDCAPLRLGIQRTHIEDTLRLTVSGPSKSGALTFPKISPLELAQTATAFALSLVDAFQASDAGQAQNLRLVNLQNQAQRLQEQLTEFLADDSLINANAENYRAFGLPATPKASPQGTATGRMRFMARWVAAVPTLDLRAVFLHGDRIVVGAARELCSLDSQSGDIMWRAATRPGVTVLTPLGVVRWHQDGLVCLHELDSGNVRFGTFIAPRSSGTPSGAVVHAPGLPKLLIVAEGERSICALDLQSGELCWRYTSRRAANFRMKRAGKLLLVSGGDSALFALDVTTGDVVWRVRERLPFTGDIALDRDGAFAICGGPVGPAKIYHLDLWSGAVRWTEEINTSPLAGQLPLLTSTTVIVPTRDRRGTGAQAFRRDTGSAAWEQDPGLGSVTTAFTSVDDTLIANSSTGMLVGLDANTGAVRFSHAFSHQVEADQPRRLQPVLRSGVLFVPQHQVHVMQPKTGEMLGTVPTDLVPDLVRVDDRSDVYVAEESGHLAAFGAAPRLSLVKA
ncbi:MAG: PQQ-binding-like beta-propeller repeat protein [Polyangiaceae bacterium]|nr:PQQ-binding-like beta-propeller repeat protein [Polyangiaceae bacterium]